MTIREDVYERYFGFKERSSKIIEMPVDELYVLARIDAPLRADDDFPSKIALFDFDIVEHVPSLKELYHNWDIQKCEPIEICKEDGFMMINNGFHRIIVAHQLGVNYLKVNMREGEFILQNHIRVSELPKLLEMLKTMFPNKSIDEIIEFLNNPDFDKEKMRHVHIGYGQMGGGD